MEKMNQMNKFKELVESSKKIYVASHINPDGDNLGSLTAIYTLLKNLGKDVYMIEDDNVPKHLMFLPNINYSVKSIDLSNDCDLFISVDCADFERLGNSACKLFEKAKHTINIDHHATNTNFAEINIVDSNSPATGELLYILFESCGYKIDKYIATNLYTAISSDTGSFKYDSVRDKTFLIASELLKFEINKSEININLYQNKSIAKTKLLISAMNTIKFLSNGKIATAYIDNDMIEAANASKDDSDGIVEFLRDIENVEVALFFKVGENNIRLSVRTKSYVDATKIVSEFSGGGHIRAAGATLPIPFDLVYDKVVSITGEMISERNFNI